MEKYLSQLIEDLEQAAKNPPSPAYIEPPPHLEEEPEIAELALVPYKPISEWTGIDASVFPDITSLEGGQWEKVNEAIFKVFDSLRLTLIDAPPDLPPEMLYDVLTTNWDHPVQFLPSSGMDLELCSGEPEICPYGEYCDCDEEFDEFELPERFKEIIYIITQSIEAGFICYLNPETLEIVEVPNSMKENTNESKIMNGSGKEELEYEKWDECYVFEPPDAQQSFEIMEDFAARADDEILQEELFYALNHKKSFANFIGVIERTGQNNDWFLFKMKSLEYRVKHIIYSNIYKIPEDFDDSELPF